MEAFKKFDKDGQGFISALDFQDIMLSIKSHLLTKDVRDNLVAVSNRSRVFLYRCIKQWLIDLR